MILEELSTDEKQRAEEIYRQLLCFNPTGKPLKPGQEWTPACSSYWFEQFIQKVLSSPGGRIRDIFIGFWRVLEVTKAPLTEWMSNFIDRMLFRYCLIHYSQKNKRMFYQGFKREEFEFMIPLVNKGCTPAQALFALHIICMSSRLLVDCKEAILRVLADTEFIDNFRYQLSHTFNTSVPLEQRLEEIFEDVKVRHNQGGLVDWNDLSSIYHAITYCNNSETLKKLWLKKILSLKFTPKLIKEAAKEATRNFEYIERNISHKSYLNEDNCELILMDRLELEIIKDFFHFKKVNFPPLELANLCEKMKKMSQTKENKKVFDFSVNQLKQDSPLPFVDIWFQADIAKDRN